MGDADVHLFRESPTVFRKTIDQMILLISNLNHRLIYLRGTAEGM